MNLLVITVARSDFGIYLPILKKIKKDKEINLKIAVSGMHLSPDFGYSYKIIEESGFNIDFKFETILSSDNPAGVSKSIALGLLSFTDLYSNETPDLIMVLGDRFDMLPGVLAALPFRIPIAHLHGGELSIGAIDDSIRHTITKLSHIHFASTLEYVDRIKQLGENEKNIFFMGSPSIENLLTINKIPRNEFLKMFKIPIKSNFILATFHPTTLEIEDINSQTNNFMDALLEFDNYVILTMPNADNGSREMIEIINHKSMRSNKIILVENLGTEKYFNAMIHSLCMVGNSSSGIIEAPFFNLPVVNIGSRQNRRVKCENVIDVKCIKKEILKGLNLAVSEKFKKIAKSSNNPYLNKKPASDIVISAIKNITDLKKLVVKEFIDLK